MERDVVMPTEPALAPEVQAEAGATIADLRAAGWSITASRYSPQTFGNWFIDLERGGRAIRLVKDRSQFMVDGPTEELRAVGLFRAFDNVTSFRQAVVGWAASQGA